MPSKTEICNLAIRRLGSAGEIQDFDTEKSKIAVACRRIYPFAVSKLHRAYAWPHSIRVLALAQLVTNDWSDEWPYAYQMPGDSKKALRIMSGNRHEALDEQIEFKVVGSSAQRILLTDQVSAKLEYCVEVTAIELYPDDFISALAWLVAADLAPSVPNRIYTSKECMELFMIEVQHAQVNAAREQRRGVPPKSEFERSR